MHILSKACFLQLTCALPPGLNSSLIPHWQQVSQENTTTLNQQWNYNEDENLSLSPLERFSGDLSNSELGHLPGTLWTATFILPSWNFSEIQTQSVCALPTSLPPLNILDSHIRCFSSVKYKLSDLLIIKKSNN